MEFFRCPCPGRGEVVLDGSYQGENKNGSGEIRILQCGPGLHEVALTCLVGRKCSNPRQEINISGTNPIFPLEVLFTCAP